MDCLQHVSCHVQDNERHCVQAHRLAGQGLCCNGVCALHCETSPLSTETPGAKKCTGIQESGIQKLTSSKLRKKGLRGTKSCVTLSVHAFLPACSWAQNSSLPRDRTDAVDHARGQADAESSSGPLSIASPRKSSAQRYFFEKVRFSLASAASSADRP